MGRVDELREDMAAAVFVLNPGKDQTVNTASFDGG